MALFFHKNNLHQEHVPQGTNEWANYPETDSRMPGLFAARATILPGEGHDFHRHPGREEVIYVLQGHIRQWIEHESRELHAGDMALIPEGMVHASFNVGTTPAILFVVLTEAHSEQVLAVDMAEEEPWRSLPSP